MHIYIYIYIFLYIYIYVGCTTVSWRCVCRLGDGTSNGNVETENNDPQVDLGLGIWYFYTRPYTESTWIKCCNGRTLTLGLFDLTTVAVRMGIEHTRAWTNAGSHEVVKERTDRKIRKYPVDEWKYIAASTGVSAIVWWGSQVLSFCICNHVVLRGSSTDSYFSAGLKPPNGYDLCIVRWESMQVSVFHHPWAEKESHICM